MAVGFTSGHFHLDVEQASELLAEASRLDGKKILKTAEIALTYCPSPALSGPDVQKEPRKSESRYGAGVG